MDVEPELAAGVTVSVSSDAERILARLVDERKWFATAQAAYLASAALALASNLEPRTNHAGLHTKWNRGAQVFDDWFHLVSALGLAGSSVAALRDLAEAGLQVVDMRLDRGSSLADAFALEPQ